MPLHPGALQSAAPLRHHRIRLADGRRVGLTVGGHGTPLVFLHGIGFHSRGYAAVLERVAAQGFLVVAIDAPGHGGSWAAPLRTSWDDRMAFLEQAIDELGIEQALYVGHSMGGRTAAALAARRPERALGAVLVNAALGDQFVDRAILRDPRAVVRFVGSALVDTAYEQARFRRLDPVGALRTAATMARCTAASPLWAAGAAHAILTDVATMPGLRTLRDQGVPTAVLHGDRDLLVSAESARQSAAAIGVDVVSCPDAWHSWLLASPASFARVLAELVEGDLGRRLRALRRPVGGDPLGVPVGCLAPGATVRGLAPAYRPVRVRRSWVASRATHTFASDTAAARVVRVG